MDCLKHFRLSLVGALRLVKVEERRHLNELVRPHKHQCVHSVGLIQLSDHEKSDEVEIQT